MELSAPDLSDADELPFADLWAGEPAPYGTARDVAGLVVMPFAVTDAVVAIIAETAAGPLAGEYVIDLGCGEGGLLIKLAWAGCRCEGVDILPGAIDTANANVAASMAVVRGSPPESAAAYRAPVFRVGDVFGDTAWWTDALSGVTVVVLFLVPQQVKKLTAELTQFLSAAPGRRVISYDYANDAFAPSFKHEIYPIYVYSRDSLKQPKVKVVTAEHAEVDPKRRYQSNNDARRRVRVLQGVLNVAECSRVVKAVDDALLRGGFERTHSAFATDDVAAFRLEPSEYAFVTEVVAQRVLPELAGNAQVPVRNLYCKDLFVVRYSVEEGAQRSLELHKDGSLMSFSLLLSEPTDFEDGGTYFAHLDALLKPSQRGTAILHDSKALHAGVEITSGTRMVLVGFVEHLEHGHDGKAPNAIDRLRQQVKHIQERQTRRTKKEETGMEEQDLEQILGLLSTGLDVHAESAEAEDERSCVQDDTEASTLNTEDDLARDAVFGGILQAERAKYVLREQFKERDGSSAFANNAFPERGELEELLAEVLLLEGEGVKEEVPETNGGAAVLEVLGVEALTAKVLFTADRVARAATQAQSAAARRHVVLSVRPEDDETNLEQVFAALEAITGGSGSALEVAWGQWELRPFCFGLQQLVVAAEVAESLQLDDLVDLVEAVAGVGSCEVQSSRPVS